MAHQRSLQLVQTLPLGDFHLPSSPSAISTWLALTALTNRSRMRLDITMPYVNLLGESDSKLFPPEAMRGFGAERGRLLFDELVAAAERGVDMRLLLGRLNNPMHSTELRRLLVYPNVHVRVWDPQVWYGGGIMHAKLWVADGSSDAASAYVGSANTDWKSLAQTMELGLFVSDARAAQDLSRLFNLFWRWADAAFPKASTLVWSELYQAELQLAGWDPAVPQAQRMHNPFAQEPRLATSWNATNQLSIGGAAAFISASPGGALVGAREDDEATLVWTARGATSSLCLNVMDFLPASAFSGGHGGAPVRWSALSDAILAVVYSKRIKVRLLVSRWAHSSEQMFNSMRALASGVAACAGQRQACAGSLEIKVFLVPGWDRTARAPSNGKSGAARWPSYTRVNHGKYMVSDTRLNVGTSNWQWGYFHQTSGTSFNTNDSRLVAEAQQLFDTHWYSEYAVPADFEAPTTRFNLQRP